ncbi:MAG: hypothetical protein KC503_30775 [Myxococcales bacterium]|nr:hypothetical protein [Myxococcales bacterium]
MSQDRAPTARTVALSRSIECASERERLWDALSDTDRLNQALGFGPLEVQKHDSGAARYLMRTRISGFALSYEEFPYEWQRPERFAVTRVYREGVIDRMDASWKLEPRSDKGTRVTFGLQLEAASRLLKPVVSLVAWLNVRRFSEVVASVDRLLAARADEDGAQREVWRQMLPGASVDHAALQRGRRALAEAVPDADDALVDLLVETIERAPDDEVARIRPFELADRWQADRNQVLDLCLAGVISGLLEMGWDIICPSCRTSSTRSSTLGEIEEHQHCQLCDLSFELDLDRTVEATFAPRLAIRAYEFRPYCVGGPARTPHVLTQNIVPAGARVELEAPREPGRYRVFVRGGASATLETTDDGGEARVELTASDDELAPARVEARPGAVVTIVNDCAEDRHVKLERLEWASLAATAHLVSLRPRFRRQFSSEVLRPGIGLKISEVALLFSDLTGSTALYSEVGDAAAYALVQDHFELLSAAIEANEGSIVKTIGDAVMAGFPDERRALGAALAMLRDFPAFCGEQRHGEHVGLKLGVHAGPCYAVRANGLLDYFGQTVNVAARLQGKAKSGEVIVTRELAERAEQRGWLEGARIVETFAAELKGVDGTLEAARVAVRGD